MDKPKPRPTPTRDRVVSKLLATTEALTAEERKIVSGYRLSTGGPAAEAERRQIEEQVRKGKLR